MAEAKKAAERKAKEGDAGGFLSVPQSQHSEYLPAYTKKPSGGE